MYNQYISFSDEVIKALDEHKPIVAIETGDTCCRSCQKNKLLIIMEIQFY